MYDWHYWLVITTAALLSSCAYSIKNIDVRKVEPMCARQCTATYSDCVSRGNPIGFKTETLRACRDAYSACIETCPAR